MSYLMVNSRINLGRGSRSGSGVSARNAQARVFGRPKKIALARRKAILNKAIPIRQTHACHHRMRRAVIGDRFVLVDFMQS
jgi:hypothetical protein